MLFIVVHVFATIDTQSLTDLHPDWSTIMPGKRNWNELAMGWSSRLSTLSKDELGNFKEIYRSPDGAIFLSKKCLRSFLFTQGRQGEYETVFSDKGQKVCTPQVDPSPQILPHQRQVDAPRETEGLPHLCRQRRLPGTGPRVQGLDDQDLGEERQREHDQRQLQTNDGEFQKL